MRLGPERFEQAAELLAAAFFDDPAFHWALPDPARRRAALRWLYRRLVAMDARVGEATALVDDDVLAGVALWMPPTRSTGVADLLRAGLFATPLELGPRATSRLVASLVAMETVKRRRIGREPHALLDVLGVAPAHQGRGVGRALLADRLEGALRGQACLLFTTKPGNVAYYRRSGFAVVDERVVGGVGGFVLWTMARPAGP